MKCLIILIAVLIARTSDAQVTVLYGTLDVTHFPTVSIPIAVSDSGSAASNLNASDFKISEDNQIQSGVRLSQCNAVNAASIVFVVDSSESMETSVGSGPIGLRNYQKFIDAFSTALSKIPDSSEVALTTFAQYSTTVPGPSRWFYKSGTLDTALFMDTLRSCFPPSLGGWTNLDSALITAIDVLSHASLRNKYIVCVSDEGPAFGLDSALRANNIAVYWMDVEPWRGSYPNYAAKFLTQRSGGEYLAAPDTALYSKTLTSLVQDIFSEHCTLQYVSADPCPWWKTHQVTLELTLDSSTAHSTTSFSLKGNTADTTPPSYRIDSSVWTRRKIVAFDNFPCEAGMWTLRDSTLENFRRDTQSMVTSDSATDSVMVTDTMSPASAIYIATDSMGNRVVINIEYHPRPDTHAPVIQLLKQDSSGQYWFTVSEMNPWDRGIRSISLDPNASNSELDSVQYFTPHYALVRAALLDPSKPAHVCVMAADSISELDRFCVEAFAGVSDIAVSQKFEIYPNPAHTAITLALPPDRESSIEITDVLGNVLLRKKASGEMQWQPEGSDASRVYFVRVATTASDGTMRVSTQRVLFE